jgi:hypothetical protein
MIPHVPRHFPYFLDQRLKPGLTRVTPLEPFIVSVLNISPPNARATHEKSIPANVILVENSSPKAVSRSDCSAGKTSGGVRMFPFVEAAQECRHQFRHGVVGRHPYFQNCKSLFPTECSRGGWTV